MGNSLARALRMTRHAFQMKKSSSGAIAQIRLATSGKHGYKQIFLDVLDVANVSGIDGQQVSS